MEIYKINLKSHLLNASNILFGLLVAILFLFFMYYTKNVDINSLSWIGLIIFLLGVLPGLIIHVNYYNVNKNQILEYFQNEGKIKVITNGINIVFVMDDIAHVDRYLSYNLEARRSSFLPWDNYNHSVIHLKDGKKIIVTSLLIPNLNLPISAQKVRTEKSVFRFAAKG